LYFKIEHLFLFRFLMAKLYRVFLLKKFLNED
jgi:hypothetical protein